jgi:hypothetical protein
MRLVEKLNHLSKLTKNLQGYINYSSQVVIERLKWINEKLKTSSEKLIDLLIKLKKKMCPSLKNLVQFLRN